MRRAVQRFWLGIPVPRPITLAFTVGYAVCVAAGVSGFIDPPSTFDAVWSGTVTRLWSSLLVIGGLLGVIAAPWGRWLVEKPALILMATGVAMYASVVLLLHVQQPDNRLIQFFMLLLVLDLLLIRYLRIHKYSFEPGR